MKRRDVLAGLGAAALAPRLGRAQSAKAHRIGFLAQKAGAWLVDPFSKALGAHGWNVGRNVELDLRFSASPADIDALAKELVRAQARVIVAVGTHMAAAAGRATTKTPIDRLQTYTCRYAYGFDTTWPAALGRQEFDARQPPRVRARRFTGAVRLQRRRRPRAPARRSES